MESARQAAAGQNAVGLIGDAGDKGLDLPGKDAPTGRADLPGKRICPVQKVQRPLQCAALFGPCERPPAGSEVITNWERYAMVFSFSSGVWLSRNQLTRMPAKASV